MPFCAYCGKEVTQDAVYCPNCGAPIRQQAAPVPTQQPTYPPAGVMARIRPTGVTIIAALEILGGIVLLVFGLLAVSLSAYYMRGMFGMLADLGSAFGGIFIVLGLISFVMAYGLLMGRGWAWTITLVLEILSALVNLFSFPVGFVGLVIDIVVIYYLTRPYVKAFFK